jgi:hypothetical protein
VFSRPKIWSIEYDAPLLKLLIRTHSTGCGGTEFE